MTMAKEAGEPTLNMAIDMNRSGRTTRQGGTKDLEKASKKAEGQGMGLLRRPENTTSLNSA